MKNGLTELQQMLVERYVKDGPLSKQDSMILLAVGMGAKEFGFEDEIMAYLETHPYATLKELDDFADPFFPELVVEED